MAAPGDPAGRTLTAAEVSLGISRHLARADVVEFSSSSSDSDSDSFETGRSTAPTATSTPPIASSPPDGAKATSRSATRRGEFFAEPEWQRAAGRWAKFEEDLLRKMKAELQDDLRAAPLFPEVVGTRRMLRFLRGHGHDVRKAATMMRKMLQWRKDNGVDDIREEIMKNQLFDPRLFPEGEMITRLYPLLVANPLCVDAEGAPISYESYDFSPREVTAHADGDLGFFIKFHIYCQEFKQICLDNLSDAKEMENLARRAARATLSPPPPKTKTAATGPRNPATTGGGSDIGSVGGGAAGGEVPGHRERGAGDGGGGRGGTVAGSSTVVGQSRSPDDDNGGASPTSAELEGGVGVSGGGVDEEGGEEDNDDDKPWGVVLRNTIIRDLSGFGVEHAGSIGRSLISQVLAVSQDNYPEMMEKCFIINAPWVFYALWKGLTPLLSASTVKKVQVLKYDFLPCLRETIPLERLPARAGGDCDPKQATPEQMYDFVVCGRVATLPEASGGAEASGVNIPAAKQEGGAYGDRRSDEQQNHGGAGREVGGGDKGGGGNEQNHDEAGGQVVGGGGGGGTEPQNHEGAGGEVAGGGSGGGGNLRRRSRWSDGGGHAGDGSLHGGNGKPHVTFRNLLERLHAREEPRKEGAAGLSLSRQTSVSSITSGDSDHRGGRQREDPRSSPGRPFASPGPRGIRRASTVGGGAVSDGSGQDGDLGLAGADEHAEDFDSRFVGEALKLSMNRKARRFKASEAGGGGGASSDANGIGGSSVSAPLAERSLDEGGWAKKTWRALKERRESKRLLKKGFLSDLPGLSAGDCAEWIPNSARNSCLHCERPFTLMLRRHHCRMCGELVCGQCSPHRVRITEEGKEAHSGDGSDGVQGAVSHRRHRRSKHASTEKRSPKQVAVRVCTDCHFSLQTVTVASASALQGYIDSTDDGDSGDNDNDSLLGGGGSGRRGEGDVSALGLVPNRRDGVVVGGGGWGFVERLEEVYSTEEIPGDVVLEDVLEWVQVQRRAWKSFEVVRMCLLVVVEMHHYTLLEAGLRAWRASCAVFSSAAKRAATALANAPPPSRCSDRTMCGNGDSTGEGGDSVGSYANRGNSGSRRISFLSSRPGSALLSAPPDPASAVAAASSSSSAPAAGTEDVCVSSPETAVARAEAALWATVDRAGLYRYAMWMLLVALLVLLLFRMW